MVSTLKPLAIPLLWLAPFATFAQSSHCPSAVSVVQKQESTEKNSIKIKRVIFTGNPVLPSSEQEEISASLSKDAFQANKLQQDMGKELKARVTQQWQKRGYFRVEVGEPEIDPASLVATVRVDAGKQYRIAELRFVKNTVFPAEKLRSLFSLRDGDIFDTHLVGEGIQKIRKLYADNGYINIVMIPTTQMDSGDGVELTVELDEGRQFRVGSVDVVGVDEVKQRQFLAASGLVTGSTFNPSRLEMAQASSETAGGEVIDVVRKINEADGIVDFKVDLRSCVSVSQK